MIYCESKSGIRYCRKENDTPVYWGEMDFDNHYFSNKKVYSDKIAKLGIRCNQKSSGQVISRLEDIFGLMYIDEVQDMVGWDLELLKLLLKSKIQLTMVGDPRQTVYNTHYDSKLKKYKDGKIRDFINNDCKKLCQIDEITLKNSYRNSAEICSLSSKLYSDFPVCISNLTHTCEHSGIFFVRESDAQDYCKLTRPLQLRWSSQKNVISPNKVMNFGDSKGVEDQHVLIYPTTEMLKWLNGHNVSLKFVTKAKLYVALTRAMFSIGIIVENNFINKTQHIKFWDSATSIHNSYIKSKLNFA
jgi:DNA helicase-2/ATP-dependent DNA helicase PcrA